MVKKNIFLTDGKNGIYKIERLIRAAILKNLETGQSVTTEIIGSNVKGFAMIKMPNVDDVSVNQPKTAGSTPKKIKLKKGKRNKASQYFGVSACKGKKPWRACLWLDGKNVGLGGFETEIEAARAVDAKLVERGLPKRNFP